MSHVPSSRGGTMGQDLKCIMRLNILLTISTDLSELEIVDFEKLMDIEEVNYLKPKGMIINAYFRLKP